MQILFSFLYWNRESKTSIQYMIDNIATEFAMYWCFLIKTNRTHLYTPNNSFFEMDDKTQLINKYHDEYNISLRIDNGFTIKKNYT